MPINVSPVRCPQRSIEASEFSPKLGNQYWPEIDGLRAVAVSSVFLFHLNQRILPGGFTGVDVFFVISGYLITNILVQDIEQRNYSILRFYQRRIARIAPAALFVAIAIIVGGYFIYSAQDFASVGATAIAAALSIVNIKMMLQGNYFKVASDAQPFLHYWSLAVEEQFYVIFPVALHAVMRFTRHALAIIFVCLVASLALCIIETPRAPTASFFMLPTRAWELLTGSILILARPFLANRLLNQSTWCLFLGVSIILLAFGFARTEGFPGWIAILPVSGSALALASIGTGQRGALHRLLAHPAMNYVGKRSYSLYLWHWPVFSFVDYRLYLASPALGIALKCAIAISATVLTYRFIESPARKWLNAPNHRLPAFAAFVAAVMAISLLGYEIRSSYYLSAEPTQILKGGISINPRGQGSVVVIGDSQGAMYGFELASLARTLGFRLNILSAANSNELPDEPNSLWPMVSAYLDRAKPDVVLLAQAWSAKLGSRGEDQFGVAITAIEKRAKRIVVLTQPPVLPATATRHQILMGARPPFFEDDIFKVQRNRVKKIIQKFESDRVHVLDIGASFEEKDGVVRAISPGGRFFYQDDFHLNDTGTAFVRGTLKDALKTALECSAR